MGEGQYALKRIENLAIVGGTKGEGECPGGGKMQRHPDLMLTKH